MRCITLHQPWASLIAAGLKTIEVRTHAYFASLEGKRIAIHAGKTYDVDAPGIISQHIDLDALTHEKLKAYSDTIAMDLCPRGVVVCTNMVARAGWMKGDRSKEALCATEGSFGLVLAELEPVDPPVKARGQQGVWEWEPEKEE